MSFSVYQDNPIFALISISHTPPLPPPQSLADLSGSILTLNVGHSDFTMWSNCQVRTYTQLLLNTQYKYMHMVQTYIAVHGSIFFSWPVSNARQLYQMKHLRVMISTTRRPLSRQHCSCAYLWIMQLLTFSFLQTWPYHFQLCTISCGSILHYSLPRHPLFIMH